MVLPALVAEAIFTSTSNVTRTWCYQHWSQNGLLKVTARSLSFQRGGACHHGPTSCHQTVTLNSKNSRRSTDHGPGLCLGRRAGSWKTHLSGMYTRFRCPEQHTRNWNRPGSSRMLQTPWYAQHADKAVCFKQRESTSGERGRKPSSLHPTAEKSSLFPPAGSCCVHADRWR